MKIIPLAYRDEVALPQLKGHFYRLLTKEKNRNKIIFKAPTGSGKTVTMACFLRDVVNELPNKFEIHNRQVAYIWIAPNTLHLQSYRSLKSFFEETRDIRTIQFEDITDSKLNPNELLFLNWQSISSDDNLYVRETEKDKSLYTYIENTGQNNTEIVVILDEAHLFGTKGEKAQKVLKLIDAKIEIDVTATPLTDSDYKVVIERADVVKAQMIKKGVILNPHLNKAKQGDYTADLILLQEALAKRSELAEKYRQAGTKINPLLLIQLPNDKEKLSEKDNEIKQLVIDFLKTRDITEKNSRLAVWLSKDKINLDDISKENSIVEVLLFKQAIALGWDCPRAHILLMYREIKQETFTIQTLGRILRMPEQKHYPDEALNIGYVYTNLQNDYIKIEADETDYITKNRSYRKKSYKNIYLPSYYRESNINRNRIGLHFREALLRTAENYWSITKDSENGDAFYNKNKEALQKIGIDFDLKNITIEIPSDLNLEIEHHEEITVKEKVRFAKTPTELQQLFEKFCLENCGDYAKDGSYERISYYLKFLFSEYFGYGETDAYKMVLHNKEKFINLLNLAREAYGNIMREKAKSKNTDVKTEHWEVPEIRIYNDKYVNYEVEQHILEPLFLIRKSNGTLTDSQNEFNFICFLEKNKKNIFWWYKNGAGNREDFAVPYIIEEGARKGEKSLFFVDIVMLFADGTLGLFDPKTPESDKNMVAKHNALIDYISRRNESGKSTVGGIVINDQNSWRYSSNKIENGYDVAGWEIFDPAMIENKI